MFHCREMQEVRSETEQDGQLLLGGGEVAALPGLRCVDLPRHTECLLLGSVHLNIDHPLLGTNRALQVGGGGWCKKGQNNRTGANRR